MPGNYSENKLPFRQLGPYVLERSLGSGGMGAVYLGIDETTGQRAAIKVLAQSLAEDPSFRLRFGAEVETLKKLKHPNIVELLGYGEQEGHLFYVMEMVDGQTLQGELQAGHCFDWQQAARIGVEICQALKHAHDRGVIHRDLKLANLLFSKDQHVKLADFGIAKLYGMGQMTAAGGVLGTADYMAPEQAQSQPVTARSDLYSLGSVLFSLLAGRPPFVGRSVPEVLHKLTTEKAPGVRRFAPHTPREFEVIIAQLLEKDPHRRIATALAAGNQLKAMAFALSHETCVANLPVEENGQTGSVSAAADESALPPDGETRAADSVVPNVDFVAGSPNNHDNCTIAADDLIKVEASDKANQPVPQTSHRSTHFTTYDEQARQDTSVHSFPEESSPLWVKVASALLGTVLIALFVWYVTRPVTANDLYAQIMKAAEATETRELAQVETEMQRFLEQFPHDPRRSEIESLREELQLYRLGRQYRRRARFRTGIDSLAVPERAYVEAIRVAEDDPYQAMLKLQALLNVYAGMPLDDNTSQCLRLARESLAEIEARATSITTENLAVINERLNAADQLAEKDREAADSIRRGVIALYRNKSWATAAVERARQALE